MAIRKSFDNGAILVGTNGNDQLTVYGHNTILQGGAGNDTYIFGNESTGDNVSASGHVIEAPGGGIDTVMFSGDWQINDGVRLDANVENLVLFGMYGAGHAYGNELNNLIDASRVGDGYNRAGGNIFGLGGNDTLIGSLANDQIYGGDGNDVISGGRGNDWIQGDNGNDRLDGGYGNDSMYGGYGNDVINGGDANESAASDFGSYGYGGNDNLFGGYGNDVLNGGNDTITSNGYGAALYAGEDSLYGGAGDDVLNGGNVTLLVTDPNSYAGSMMGGVDWFEGGYGNDVINAGNVIEIGGNGVFGSGNESFYGGNNDLYGDYGNDILNLGNLTIIGNGGNDGIYAGYGYAVGGFGDDVINGGANLLDGGAGDDVIMSVGEDTGDGDFFIGGYGNDIINGGSNVVRGGDGNDKIYGSMPSSYYGDAWTDENSNNENDGNDIIRGKTETLDGGAGDDYIYAGYSSYYGGGGNDVIIGGNETILAGTGNDRVFAGQGGAFNSMFGGYGNDTLTAGQLTINLGTGEDHIYGDYGYGVGYSDLYGFYGNDVLNGNTGNDALDGGAGNDTLNGGAGNDRLYGGAGNDVLNGGAGDDKLVGGYGGAVDDDILNGGAGNDSYYVSWYGGHDTILADPGGDDTAFVFMKSFTAANGIDNIISTGYGDQVLTGNAGDNYIYGNSGDDVLVGMDGNDVLDGGSGDDRMIGGLGNDNYFVDSYGDVVVEAPGGGIDSVFVSGGYGYGRLAANVENLTLGYGNGQGHTTIIGNNLNNVLTGNFYGGTIYGGGGNDTLITGGGADKLFGGAGNDTYVVENGNDLVVELNGGGTDTVISNGNFRLGANIENLVLTDGHYGYGFFGAGNSLANRLEGSRGNDYLNGYGGNDTMIGGAGDDTFIVDSINDVATEAANGGSDIIYVETTATSGTFVMGANVESGVLDGSSGLNLTGNASNNTMTGNAGANLLSGLAGNDNISGGGGNDQLSGGYGNDFLDGQQGVDVMNGGFGNDTYVVNRGDGAGTAITTGEDVVQDAGGIDTVNSAVYTYTLGTGIENLNLVSGVVARQGVGNGLNNIIIGNGLSNTLNGMDGNDTLNGGSGADTLIGGNGNDVLDGGLGNDSMTGGAGNDTYIVDSSSDVVTESTAGAAGGVDLVRSTVNITLATNVENGTLYGGATLLAGNTGNNVLKGNATIGSTVLGNDGNDTVIGGKGNDDLVGGIGNDLLQGNDGNDGLYGGDGTDNLQGGAGSDWLDGGSGVDTMAGGAGNDTYVIDRTADIINEGANAGHDTVELNGPKMSYTLGSNIEDAVVYFSGGYGSEGHTITGNGLNNFISGDYGDNTLSGGAGDDELWGAGGFATFSGGGTGNDTLNGDAGNDLLYGGDGNDHLNGGTGDDQLFAGSGDDIMTGGDGNDLLDGGAGNDTMTGGLGDDLYRIDSATDVVTEAAGGGIDTEQLDRSSNLLSFNLAAQVENLHLTGGANAIGAYGNGLANVFNVDAVVTGDVFDGGAGSDTLNTAINGNNTDGSFTLDRMETVNLNAFLQNDGDWTVHAGNTAGQTINVSGFVYNGGSSLTIDQLAADATVALGGHGRLYNDGGIGVGNSSIVLALNDDSGGSDVLHVTLGGSLGDLNSGNDGANLVTSNIETLAFKVQGDTNELNVAGVANESLLSFTGNTGDLILTGLDDGQNIQLQNFAAGFVQLSLNNSSGTPNALHLFVDNAVIGDNFYNGWLAVDNDGPGIAGLENLTINTQGGLGFEHGGSFINGEGFDPDLDVQIYGGQDLTLYGFGGHDVDASALSGNLRLSATGGNNTQFTAGYGDDMVNLGNGNDTFVFGGQLDDNDKVYGGGGIDTLSADMGLGGHSLHVHDVENLDFALSSGATSFDLSDVVSGNVDIDLTGADANVTFATPNFSGSVNYSIDASALTGASSLNAITGAGNDTLVGSLGDDTLNGTTGSDSLTGGGGNDTFVFNNLGNGVDTIADFENAGAAAGDSIALSLSVFGDIGSVGTFDASSFHSGTGGTLAATSAQEHILYDTASGALYYDGDGNGSDVAVQFAVVSGNPAITADDFTVVS